MKNTLFLLIFLLMGISPCLSQEIMNDPGPQTNETIQQISTTGIENILDFQTLNQGIGNSAFIQQTGNHNKAGISQQSDAAISGNLSYTVQTGNENELTVGQIGSGNLLLGFQLGYLASTLTGREQGNHYGLGLGNGNGNAYAYGHLHTTNDYLVEGERNKLTITQNGTNNGVMAIQMGSDNTISAAQTGTNNYLAVLQTGKNNRLTGYTQANTSDKVLFDTVIQIGENLTLDASEDSKSKPNGNKFTQSGTNLSLQLNNEFVNSVGGIEIDQKGKDMKVVIDQSYFSFPKN